MGSLCSCDYEDEEVVEVDAQVHRSRSVHLGNWPAHPVQQIGQFQKGRFSGTSKMVWHAQIHEGQYKPVGSPPARYIMTKVQSPVVATPVQPLLPGQRALWTQPAAVLSRANSIPVGSPAPAQPARRVSQVPASMVTSPKRDPPVTINGRVFERLEELGTNSGGSSHGSPGYTSVENDVDSCLNHAVEEPSSLSSTPLKHGEHALQLPLHAFLEPDHEQASCNSSELAWIEEAEACAPQFEEVSEDGTENMEERDEWIRAYIEEPHLVAVHFLPECFRRGDESLSPVRGRSLSQNPWEDHRPNWKSSRSGSLGRARAGRWPR